MGEHTKEPWTFEPASGGLKDSSVAYEEGAYQASLGDETGKIICYAYYDDALNDEEVEEQDACLRRAATAVNFTAGYEIPADVTLDGMLRGLRKALSAIDDANDARERGGDGRRGTDLEEVAGWIVVLLSQFQPTPDDSTDTGDAP